MRTSFLAEFSAFGGWHFNNHPLMIWRNRNIKWKHCTPSRGSYVCRANHYNAKCPTRPRTTDGNTAYQARLDLPSSGATDIIKYKLFYIQRITNFLGQFLSDDRRLAAAPANWGNRVYAQEPSTSHIIPFFLPRRELPEDVNIRIADIIDPQGPAWQPLRRHLEMKAHWCSACPNDWLPRNPTKSEHCLKAAH